MHTSQPGNDQSCIFYNQPKPNIQPWKHLALCTIVSANCWKSSDFWLLYKLIKLIKSILIYKDFNYCPIFQSIILVGKVTDQTLKSQLLKGQPLHWKPMDSAEYLCLRSFFASQQNRPGKLLLIWLWPFGLLRLLGNIV